MELPSELKQALERLQAGITDAADLETLRRALQAGQIALTTGERAVAIGGSVEDTVIVTGDNNIVFKGATAESVREALQKVLERIASDRYAASLQEYFRALRRYCAEQPYLTLTDIRPPKNLDEVYVPLRARQRENEPLPRGPVAQEESLTVEQVLRQAQTSHLLILGQPGAGKSTLLRQLAERAYDDPHAIGLDRPHLPLLLPLRALAHAEGSLEERLNQALQNELRLTRPLPAGFLDAWPQQLDTPWLFLLDGLDEVPADRYLSLKQWIGDLLAHPNIARVILTSRPSVYTEKEWESSRLSVYEIQPFTRDQTADLARRWFGEDAPTFLQALETVRSSVLIETPLLVTIAAKVYLERKSLPERRSQLYQEFVDIWLDEARERGLCDELDAALLDLAQPALAHLALAMTEHPDWTDEKSLKPVVAEYLNEQLNLKARAPAVAERFLRVMARRSGVFLKREERYEWVHPTFREYFAALALNQQLESGKSFEEVLGARVMQEEWEETIVALAEVCAQAIELIIWLSRERVVKNPGKTAFLVKRCWEASDAISSNVAQAAVVDVLITALNDPNMDVRWRVAEALGKIGDPRAIEPLIVALHDSHKYVRTHAANALVRIGTPAVMPLSVVLHDRNVYVRLSVAKILRKIGVAAIETLIASLRYSSEDVCWYSAFALAKIGKPAVELLIGALSDPNEGVRSWTAFSLGEIGDRRAIQSLICALQDPSKRVRAMAANALGEIGDTHAVKPLITILDDPDENVRRIAAKALKKICNNVNAFDSLIDALNDPNENVRRHAVYIVGKIGGARAVQPLVDAICDHDEIVRDFAARALKEIGPVVIRPLVDLVVMSNIEAGLYTATEILIGFGTDAVEPLIEALENPKESIRERVANILIRIGVPAIKPIVAALRESTPYARRMMTEILGEIGDRSAVQPLITMLQDFDKDVRRSAAEALGKISDPSAVKHLLAALHDPNKYVRRQAVLALEKIGHPQALPELERVAHEDPRRIVADAAREAIARIRKRMEKTA
jgi:HEAT repeat protein